jgi:hypothetical protein
MSKNELEKFSASFTRFINSAKKEDPQEEENKVKICKNDSGLYIHIGQNKQLLSPFSFFTQMRFDSSDFELIRNVMKAKESKNKLQREYDDFIDIILSDDLHERREIGIIEGHIIPSLKEYHDTKDEIKKRHYATQRDLFPQALECLFENAEITPELKEFHEKIAIPKENLKKYEEKVRTAVKEAKELLDNYSFNIEDEFLLCNAAGIKNTLCYIYFELQRNKQLITKITEILKYRYAALKEFFNEK